MNRISIATVLLALLAFGADHGRSQAKKKLDIRIGYLTDQPMNHPRVTDRDDYLDLYDKKGKWKSQIIIVFEADEKAPKDRSRPIRAEGRIKRIDLGGPAGTRGSYTNDVLYVTSWKYVAAKDVPRAKE